MNKPSCDISLATAGLVIGMVSASFVVGFYAGFLTAL